MRILICAVALVASLLLAAPAVAQSSSACTGNASAKRYGTSGYVAYPRRAPRAIVVVAHGYSHTAAAWRSKLASIARGHRAVAVAIDYRGQRPDPSRPGRSRGFPVRLGAADLAATTRALQRRCRGDQRTVLLGFSMGGNIGSVAVARYPGRWDAFLGVEGIYDLEGTWRAGSAVRANNAFADQALDDIEAETGGSPDERGAAYDARNPVERAAEVARGTRRVTLVHARDDGLALYSFAEEMARRVRRAGRAVRFVTVGPRGSDDEPDTSLAETLGQPRQGAGHASDTATRHVTIETALRELGRLVRG